MQPGDPVKIKMDNEKTWSKSGTIVDLQSSPRSFMVDTGNGIYRWNRRHLAKLPWLPVSQSEMRPPDPAPQLSSEQEIIEPDKKSEVESPEPMLQRSERQSQLPSEYKDFDMGWLAFQ